MDKPRFEDLFPKPTLIVMVGLPGSGKSTIAKQLAEDNPNTLIFSSDAYREKICGDENDQSNNDLVFRTLHKDLREALLLGKNCIFDAICWNGTKSCINYVDESIIFRRFKINWHRFYLVINS